LVNNCINYIKNWTLGKTLIFLFGIEESRFRIVNNEAFMEFELDLNPQVYLYRESSMWHNSTLWWKMPRIT